MPQSRALPSELTIYTLAALHREWLEWLASVPKARRTSAQSDAPWPVDASAVDEVDAAGVQLLLALSHSLAAKRRALRLINASGPLASACEALGAATLLMSEPGSRVNA
jgi:anti-anti-sigma regulatory factor